MFVTDLVGNGFFRNHIRISDISNLTVIFPL